MNAKFSQVDIHVFDVHTTTRPLLTEGCVGPKFKFLVQPDAYKEAYSMGKPVLTPSFNVHPLSQKFRRHNQFWKNYLLGHGGDYWKLQLPFMCSIERPQVAFKSGPASFVGKVVARAYLSALGWSSNVDIYLSGDIKLPQLRDFVGALRGVQPVPPGGPCLTLDGQPAAIGAIFSHLRDLLLTEVYAPDSPPQAVRHEERQFVISLAEFEGQIISFRQTARGEGMTDADRALVYSVLRGRSFEVADFRKEIAPGAQPYTVTTFADRQDFMLTLFDYGTLMFLQHGARKESGSRGPLRCYASNVRSFAQVVWTLYYFYQDSQQAADNHVVNDLRTAVKANLQRLRDRLNEIPHTTNSSLRYAKTLFTHPKLKKLLA